MARKKIRHDSPPQKYHCDTGLGNCGRALHVLEGGYTAANAGAFVGNAEIPPGAHSVRFKPAGVSYHRTYGYVRNHDNHVKTPETGVAVNELTHNNWTMLACA